MPISIQPPVGSFRTSEGIWRTKKILKQAISTDEDLSSKAVLFNDFVPLGSAQLLEN